MGGREGRPWPDFRADQELVVFMRQFNTRRSFADVVQLWQYAEALMPCRCFDWTVCPMSTAGLILLDVIIWHSI
jgi:hypothetical protein